MSTGKVTIRGSGPGTVLLLDGVEVHGLRAFRLIGEHPDVPTKLILEIDAMDVDVESEVEVERRP